MLVRLLLLLILPFSDGEKIQKSFLFHGKSRDYKVCISKDVAETGKSTEASVDSILVLDKGDEHTIQVIVCEENYFNCTKSDTPGFFIDDMNFDGREDFKLLESSAKEATNPYFYWLYNPLFNRYEQSPGLEEIMSPVFNKGCKCITSNWKKGSNISGKTTYKYISGLLEVTEEITEETLLESVYVTTRKLVDGQLKTISKNEPKEVEEQ